LTKNAIIDDGLPKYHMPLEEANRIIEANMKVIGSDSIGLCGIDAEQMHNVEVEPSLAKHREARPKVDTIRNKLGRIMHKIYDLEPECVPEKPLNLDLAISLYQMEDY